MSSHVRTIGLLASCALGLSGCVAAVIPLAAGGAIFGKDRLDGAPSQNVAVETEAAGQHDTLAQTTQVPPAEPVLKRENARVTPPGPVFVDLADIQPRTPNVAEELPASMETDPPARGSARSAPSASSLSVKAYESLFRYTEAEARRDPAQRPRQSAMLAAPGSLAPVRADCSIRPPAVLIDLDPATGLFDAGAMQQAQPALSGIIAGLRSQEIDIFWISGQTALKAADIRRSLVASGLDADGKDGLLLMRRADDRKQQRRNDVQQTHCLIAIAGDTRSDFDELYDFLKDPDLAQPLEELVGAGWFLAPLPLSAGPAPFVSPPTPSEG